MKPQHGEPLTTKTALDRGVSNGWSNTEVEGGYTFLLHDINMAELD